MKTLYKKIIVLLSLIITINIIAAEKEINFTNINNWILEKSSSYLNFTSIKNNKIVEVHRFNKLSGEINKDGIVDVVINLKSVNTGIEIRDQRLQEYIFDTKKYPTAIFSAHIDVDKILSKLYQNPVYKTILEGYLNLKEHKVLLKIPVDIKYLSNKRVQIMSTSPIMLNINDFKMADGLEKIKNLVNLDSIGVNIPVNFKVVFIKK